MDFNKFKILYDRFSKFPLSKGDSDSQEYNDYIDAMSDSQECSDWYLKNELDKKHFDYSKFCCLSLAKHISDGFDKKEEQVYKNVDVILRKWDNGSIGIPIHDGGTSMIIINYCPFCGTKI